MKQFSFLIKYLKYWFLAKNGHGIHSPFVFGLYNDVINKKGSYYSFDKIEQLRKKLLASKKKIEVKDLGAGRSGKRTISKIAEGSAKNRKYCELLFRLAYHFKPTIILELGTSLGISTSYLASANPNTQVITIEGCPNTAAEAKKNFESLGLKNIEPIVGNFDVVLPDVLASSRQQGAGNLVFIDGNHRKAPTLNYFKLCLARASNDSIFIFDDIHWSDEMEDAWEEIKAHPNISLTVDLFFLGIVFFRKEQVKENFTLRY
ncbi:MAG: class I SAM-dependent methyltransferase [Bacteroidetes bacterium]|nr:MAG: class I SAM-dependent methyltransferase [Bacteroidota bacterium]